MEKWNDTGVKHEADMPVKTLRLPLLNLSMNHLMGASRVVDIF